MSANDDAFQQVVESCAGGEGEVDYSDDGWKPKDGNYTVVLEKFTKNVSVKDGLENARGNAILRIVAGEYEGRAFGEFFWMPGNASKLSPGMSNFLRLAKCLSDREFKLAEVGEASLEISEQIGAVLNVRVFTKTNPESQKVYTNTRFLELVTEESGPVEVPV